MGIFQLFFAKSFSAKKLLNLYKSIVYSLIDGF